MRGLTTDRTAQVIVTGHAFVQNFAGATTSSVSTRPVASAWQKRSPS